MDENLLRESIAELIGTFVLVFVGGAAVLVAPIFGVVVPALAHGLVLCGLIYTYGHISGAQINPAVTVGLTVCGKQDMTRSAYYIVAQFIGGIIAALVLAAVFPQDNAGVAAFLGENSYNFGQTTGFLTEDSVWTAAAFEAILTFFLASTVIQAAGFGRAGKFAGIAIGFTLAASILAGGAATGASLNPARTLGPALIAGDTSYLIPYLIGIFGGGIIAGLVQGNILNPDELDKQK